MFYKFEIIKCIYILNPAEAYILNQPEPFRSILLHVQVLIEHTIPEIELKYKWKIPCYYAGKTPICYLNASHKNQFVDVAFWHSAHLEKYDAYLVSEKRKVVKSLRYKTLNDINDVILIEILKEVYHLKEKGFYKKS